MAQDYTDFPLFYTHPIIQKIANNEKWTVSDNDKKPIDMFAFMTKHIIHGALCNNNTSLVNLETLCKTIPNAANHAYYLDAFVDGIVVLDIEPKCPDEIKQELLKLPYLYGEISLSGNGLHLVFALPDCHKDYPIVAIKKVLKEEHGYYEILLDHWCTFTRNMIPITTIATDTTAFDTLFCELAQKQTDVKKREIEIDKIDPKTLPYYEKITTLLKNQKYKKTLSDFYDDYSLFEYGYIGYMHFKLKQILQISAIKEAHVYSDNDCAWLLYVVAREQITYRPKHDETRDGLPWLLYLAQNIIAKSIEE